MQNLHGEMNRISYSELITKEVNMQDKGQISGISYQYKKQQQKDELYRHTINAFLLKQPKTL